jgi:CO dehydrogenase maturation factor
MCEHDHSAGVAGTALADSAGAAPAEAHPVDAAGHLGGYRVVVTGKGGVGKTSLTALLARLLARDGHRVLALDADPQMNLPYAIGLPVAEARGLVPISQNRAYVEEKTGASSDAGYGLYFRLNPDATDAVERYAVTGPDGVQVMVMGTTVQPAAGCLCPENTLLAGVVEAMNLREREVILLDTQAGVEHFGRALAKGFHHALVVCDPTFNAVQVAVHAARLASDMGIPAVHLVANRVRDADEAARLEERLAEAGGFGFTSTHVLPYDEAVLAAEPSVTPLLEAGDGPLLAAVASVVAALARSEEALTCVS